MARHHRDDQHDHRHDHRDDRPAGGGASTFDALQERRRTAVDDSAARDRFAGMNLGACFFGWLVAVAVAILLTSIVGAVVAAVGSSTGITQTEAERESGTIGVAAAVVLLVVLLLGYYAGGYVAGRMSRFDGGRQGVGVWVIGLVVTVVAVVLGAVFGSQYNILDRVSLPRIPVSTQDLSIGAVVTALAVVLGTLLAAVLGGKVGHRYHDRVDRAVIRH
ncbi:MFS family permease [Nocardioides zeae]|uniref:MFS family permease n=1 Tax=Nocardioides zeae TaxID=1457234 RepID=A0ACC6IM00_9ACTN|nr:hypothetical protein [Nocardioides zeae]MDR6173225.1 MFS family permease [Nocardioides zeae]MDR6211772.1 MFS family permease [Nocardioides zeae]